MPATGAPSIPPSASSSPHDRPRPHRQGRHQAAEQAPGVVLVMSTRTRRRRRRSAGRRGPPRPSQAAARRGTRPLLRRAGGPGRRRHLRAGHRRGAAGAGAYRRAGLYDLGSRRKLAYPPTRWPTARPNRGRRLRPASPRAGEDRRDLHHALQNHGPMEPHASLADVDGDRLTIHSPRSWSKARSIDRRDPADPAREGRGDQPVHRRRLRRQAGDLCRRDAGGAGGARSSAAGEGRVDPPADVHVTTHRAATIQRVRLAPTRTAG